MYKDISSTEFEIIKLLWKRERLSSKEIHDELAGKTKWAYSTTRTVIDRMVKKDFLIKETFHGLNVYGAKLSKVQTLAQQVSEFAERILETDPLAVLPLFAKSEVLSPEELGKLRALLNEKEAGK